MPGDPLLEHFEALEARAKAWETAWARRGETSAASVALLLSQPYLGQTLGQQIERRLLEGRREIDNQLTRFAGMVAAAIALLCRAGDTEALERSIQESMSKIGRVEDGFDSKLAELRPLVALYARLNAAVGPVRSSQRGAS